MSWVLSMGEAAELLEPPELRDELRGQLRRLADRLARPPLDADAATGLLDDAAAPGARRPTATADGRLERRSRPLHSPCDPHDVSARRLPRRRRRRRDAGAGGDGLRRPRHDAGRAAADVRLLNLVNFGGEGTLLWAELKGETLVVTCDVASSAFARPARLSPLQVDTLLLAVEILGGQLPIEHGAALRSAAQKLRRARSAAPPTVAAGERLPTAEPILDAVNAAIGGRRLLDIEYWSEGSGTTSTRTVEPYLLVRTRGEWYYVAWCRRSQGTRTFRVATTKRALLRGEHFTPRPEVEVELYRREGVRSSERYAPRRAVVWYAAAVARWVAEREPTVTLPAGGCLARQPYVDERWLTHELLRFGGEALPLSPPAAVEALRDLVVAAPRAVRLGHAPPHSRRPAAVRRPAAGLPVRGLPHGQAQRTRRAQLARLRLPHGHRLPAGGRHHRARGLLRLPRRRDRPAARCRRTHTAARGTATRRRSRTAARRRRSRTAAETA